MNKVSVFGVGFIGKKYCEMYQTSTIPIQSGNTDPLSDNVLYARSTTHNYNVFDDLHLDINVNLNGLVNVLPKVNGTFSYISSWFVYGDGYGKENPAKESDDCRPKGFYSITKKTAEDLVESYCKTFDKKYRILRLCNVVGGDSGYSNKKNALEFMINSIVKGEQVNVYKGDNYRNIMHVEDVCAAINLIVEKGKENEIYNIGAENSYKIIDIVDYVANKTNSTSKITQVDAQKFHKIVQAENFFMDTTKLKQLGFVQKYTLFQTIDKILEKIKS